MSRDGARGWRGNGAMGSDTTLHLRSRVCIFIAAILFIVTNLLAAANSCQWKKETSQDILSKVALTHYPRPKLRIKLMSRKRKPGRPVGTGIDDSIHLSEIADLIVGEPDLSKTAAIGNIVCVNFENHNHEAAKRRLQRKWLRNSGKLLEAAAVRRSVPRKISGTIPNGLPRKIYFSELSQVRKQVYPLPNAVQQIQDMLDPPTLRALRDAIKPPALRALRDAINPPALRALHDAINPPALRAMRNAIELSKRI